MHGLVFMVVSCAVISKEEYRSRLAGLDEDSDGYDADEDCNDGDSTVNPGAIETCSNEVDDDCDGQVNEPGAEGCSWYGDQDQDGWGDAEDCRCEQDTPSMTDRAGDCDDSDGDVHPGADERCNGEDDDCDDEADEGKPTDAPEWYADADGDGYGDAGDAVASCGAPSGWVADATDCDDTDGSINPDATEVCNGLDDDCDGATDDGDDSVDAPAWYTDADGDGYGDPAAAVSACEAPDGTVADGTDCDDSDAAKNPGAAETWYDGVDGDCAGGDDYDADGDGEPSDAWGGSDCDDGDAAVGPDVPEICDGQDNDCDGLTDDGDPSLTGAPTWYEDRDGDGYGNAAETAAGCVAPSGYVGNGDDCSDTNPLVLGPDTWCFDADLDGFGDAAVAVLDCSQPAGYLPDCTDCDDADPSLGGPWKEYPDADADGYGDESAAVDTCTGVSGRITVGGDCDDGDDSINPGAFEWTDGIDNDCDGDTDVLGLEHADGRYYSETERDKVGYSVTGAGDVDGDGFDDVLVGAYGNFGAAYLFLGPATGEQAVSAASTTLLGSNTVNQVRGGDVDGDGYSDLLVADDEYYGGAFLSGAVFLVMGPATAGGDLSAAAGAALNGTNTSDRAGAAIDVVRDIDGDGYRELLVGAPSHDVSDCRSGANDGATFLVAGPVTGDLDLDTDNDTLIEGSCNAGELGSGSSVAGCDVDATGLTDVLLGASGYGSGGTSGALFGFQDVAPGELSTDGDTDFLAYGDADSAFATSISCADVDGDGKDDFIIGAPNYDSYRGQVYLFFGSTTALSGSMTSSAADVTLDGTSDFDYAGYSVAIVDNLYDTTLRDVVVGAYGASAAFSRSGAVWLELGASIVLGGTFDLADSDALFGGESTFGAGASVAGAGDVDGDGWGDILIGDPLWNDGSGASMGAAYLLLGPGP